MNLSGGPVSDWARAHSVERTDVLVYLDDVALPLGSIRLRERGTDGGHNGLASVLSSLGGTDVPRMRIGIRPPAPEGPAEADDAAEAAEKRLEDLAEFVLAPFTVAERPIVDDVLSRVLSATRTILSAGTGGMARAMALYNGARSPDRPARSAS
jgi:PTH1 family peptidyl-tRNA hydrolase